MARTAAELPAGVRISEKVTVGQFAKVFPPSAVQAALRDADRETVRNRELPNHIVVYLMMLLALFRESSQQEVLRCLYEGLQWLFELKDFKITGKSGISQARARVGWEPLYNLFHSVALPLAEEGNKYAFFRGLRMVALDGSVFEAADTAENWDRLWNPKNGRGSGSYPQARIVSLVECGTHAMFRIELGERESEMALAHKVVPSLDASMICLADRLFMCFPLFKAAHDTGAKLVWRASNMFRLDPQQGLSDGSYFANIYDRYGEQIYGSMKVRVIEYKLKGAGERIRLVTNILDPKQAPAEELARLYHERWEFENMLDELKTHLGASEMVLRSKTPDLVKQEILGMVCAHYAIRTLMHDAAFKGRLDDDELSFTHSLRVVRRRLPMYGSFPPRDSVQAHDPGDTPSPSQFQQGTLKSSVC